MRAVLTSVAVLALLAAGAAGWALLSWNAPGPGSNPGVILIQPGTRTHAIATQLEDAGLVRRGLVFEFDLRLKKLASRLKAGEYAIPPRASMAEIAAILESGKSIQHKLTAAEGLTSDMIWKLVAADEVLLGDAGPVPEEGTLLPETYLFTRGTTRKELLARMAKAQSDYLARIWPGRATGLPYTTLREAVVLASIVEKETALAQERPHIAAVFVNRLKAGIRLQSDPTIIYGITKGYPLGRAIKESEITGATPYNTYVITGLPPAPIANPGKEALAAVLKPDASSDLYFVANGRGGHVFAATIAEHARNVIAWRVLQKLKDKGGVLAAPPAVKGQKHTGIALRKSLG